MLAHTLSVRRPGRKDLALSLLSLSMPQQGGRLLRSGQAEGLLFLWLVVLGRQENTGKGRTTWLAPEPASLSFQRGRVKRYDMGAGFPKRVLIAMSGPQKIPQADRVLQNCCPRSVPALERPKETGLQLALGLMPMPHGAASWWGRGAWVASSQLFGKIPALGRTKAPSYHS